MGIIRKNNAVYFIFLNAFLWGSSYVWYKILLGYLPSFSLLFLSSLGGLIITVTLFHKSLKNIEKSFIIPSILTSLLLALSNFFQVASLNYTSSSNTAFIIQLSVIFTPIIMAVMEKKIPQGKIILSAFAALIGLFILTCDFDTFRLNVGDMLALGTAVFFSIYIVSLNYTSGKFNAIHFSFIQHTTNVIIFFVLSLVFETKTVNFSKLYSTVFFLLIFANVLVALITVFVQSSAIKFVRPEKTALIYTLEPVVAFILAYMLIGERLDGIKAVVGLFLILGSVIYSIYIPKSKKVL